MNKETLLEAYNDEVKKRVEAENACQDILFILEEALSDNAIHLYFKQIRPPCKHYLKQIKKRLESVL